MKSIVLLMCVAAVLGAPQIGTQTRQENSPPFEILSYVNSPTGDGGNQHSYTTENQIEREEGVFIEERPCTHKDCTTATTLVPVYRGFVKYIQPDGSEVFVEYVADERGYRPVGDSIPKLPAQ